MILENEYLKFDTDTGKLTFTSDGILEVMDLLVVHEGKPYCDENIMVDMFESIRANSEYAYISDIGDYGALSNAEGIGLMAEEIKYGVDWEYPKIFWAWDHYQIRSMLDALLTSDSHTVTLTKYSATKHSNAINLVQDIIAMQRVITFVYYQLYERPYKSWDGVHEALEDYVNQDYLAELGGLRNDE
jgi:hypothetical protein